MRTVNFLSGALVKLKMRRFKQSFTCSGSKLSRPSRSSTGPNDARNDAHQADSGKAGLDKGPVLRTPPSLVEISSSSSDKSDKKKDNSTMTRLMSSTEEVTSQGCPLDNISQMTPLCSSSSNDLNEEVFLAKQVNNSQIVNISMDSSVIKVSKGQVSDSAQMDFWGGQWEEKNGTAKSWTCRGMEFFDLQSKLRIIISINICGPFMNLTVV